MERLAVRLKEACEQRGLSQNEVATKLQVSRQSISKWENDRAYPDLDNLILLSDIYQLSLDELISTDDEPHQIDINQWTPHEGQRDRSESWSGKREDESLMLILIVLTSAMIAPLGVFVPIQVLCHNDRSNNLHKAIIIIALIVIVASSWRCWTILSDSWLNLTEFYQGN